MSTFVLKRNYGLELPGSYVEIDKEEMQYVDGGGTVSIHFCGSTLAGLGAGYLGATALAAALSASVDAIGLAFIVGTAGTGTVVAGALVIALQVAIPAIVGGIMADLTSSLVNGYTHKISAGFLPTATFNF